MLRNEYTFGRRLTADETTLLEKCIAWRVGSRVITDQAGAGVCCVAHPDDIAEFEKALRIQARSLRPVIKLITAKAEVLK